MAWDHFIDRNPKILYNYITKYCSLNNYLSGGYFLELHPLLKALKPVIKGLAQILGSEYEVVLHDLADPDHSIIAIENGHVTGRQVGDPLADYAMYLLKASKGARRDFVTNFLSRTSDGKRIRSSTLYLRDEKDQIVGYLCINYDMTKAELARGIFDHLLKVSDVNGYSRLPRGEEMPSSFEEILERNLKLIRERAGKPLNLLSKAEKLEFIKALDEEGFFLLKGSVEALAEETGNTKYTIYSYLREVREEKEGSSQ